MTTPADLEAFNWVRARATCNAPEMFKQLRMRVEDDAKTANQLIQRDVKVSASSDLTFSASVPLLDEQTMAEDGVTFRLQNNGVIEVADPAGRPLFSATPHLINGDCLLQVDDQYLRVWEVSRRALARLIFPH